MESKSRGTLGRAERIELEFLEAVAERCPKNQRVLEVLGEMYTKSGCYSEGLRVDLELTRVCPGEATHWYNLACSYALMGRREDAFESLAKAVDLGYSDRAWMSRDEDLVSLREDPRFIALLERVGRSAGETSNSSAEWFA
jgi:Flp pilus assembly protein TadD